MVGTLLLLLLLAHTWPVSGQPELPDLQQSQAEAQEPQAWQTQQLPQCSSEEQLIQCGQLPFDTPEALTAYVQCCQLFEFRPLPPAAQAAEARATASQAVVAASTPRPDLDLTPAGRFATAPNYLWESLQTINGKPASSCVTKAQVTVPTFTAPQQVTYKAVTAPQLTSTQIKRVKSRGLALTYKVSGTLRRAALRMRVMVRRTAPAATTFTHPAGLMSPAEVAMMQHRLNGSISPQTSARDSLLSGATVSKD